MLLQSVHAVIDVKPGLVIDSAASLERAYHTLIPISAHMGIAVESYDGNSLVLSAPLSNNINHQQSGFGGSLFSVAALAGWGILQLKINEMALTCDTVIADGSVSYTRAVFEDFTCRIDLPDDWPEFAAHLKDRRRASLMLTPTVFAGGAAAMTLSGKYAVRQKS